MGTYWEDRALITADKVGEIAKMGEKGVLRIFNQTNQRITDEVSQFYGKYGVIASSPTYGIVNGAKVITGYSEKLVVPPDVANSLITRRGDPVKRITRLENLQTQMNSILTEQTRRQVTETSNVLKNVAETVYYDEMYNIYSTIGMGQSFQMLTPANVTALINNPLNGANFSKTIWDNRSTLASQVNRTLRNGIVTGLSVGQMTKELHGKVGGSYKNAQRIIQTESTNVANQASVLSYKASGVVSRYIYLALLDNRTSSVCRELDYKIFDLKDAQTGVNLPPMHPNCRSSTGAYFDETSTMFDRMAKDESGKYFRVPSDMTAKDFRAIYVDKTMTRADWDKIRSGVPVVKVPPVKVPKVPKGNKVVPMVPKVPKSLKVKDAKTFDELTATLQTKYNPNFLVEDGVKNLDFVAVKDAVEGIERVIDDFPSVGEMFKAIRINNSGLMCAWQDGQIGFHSYYFEKNEHIVDKLKGSVNSHLFPKNTYKPFNTGVHEAGHMVNSSLIYKKHPDGESGAWIYRRLDWEKHTTATEVIGTAVKRLKKLPENKGMNTSDFLFEVSTYSSATRSEAVAECISDWYANGESASRLSKEVMKVLREEFAK